MGVLGVALLLVGGGALLISMAFAGDPRAEVLGPSVAVNAGAGDPRDLSAHNSPTLARSPRDPAALAIANRIDTPRYSCALHVSFDGGASWRQTPIPVPEGEEPKCYAPDVVYGADGTLYLLFVTLEGRGNVPSAGWLVRSQDGGRTLSEPEKVLGPLAFQARLVAHPTVAGRLYLTSLRAEEVGLYRFSRTGNPVWYRRSDDGGRTWAVAPLRISSRSRERVVAPSLGVGGPEGRLYALYLDLGDDRLDYAGAHEGRGGPPYQGTWSLIAARSDDGGVTWRESVVDDGVVPTERFVVFLPKSPSLAVDREDGSVYVSYHDGRFGTSDVLVWRSSDGAQTWSEPARVNDTPNPDESTQAMPQLEVAPGGRLDVVYYDRRADERDVRNGVSLQSSYDGGQTFTPRTRVSDRSFDSRVGFGSERDLPDLGSRLALLSTDQRALAVWPDARAGTQVSGKQDLYRAVVGFAEPARLPGAVKAALRYGGLVIALLGLALSVRWTIALRAGPAPDEELHGQRQTV